jgi:hypothetical protein
MILLCLWIIGTCGLALTADWGEIFLKRYVKRLRGNRRI